MKMKYTATLILLLSVVFMGNVYSEVMITPTRVVLENGKRSTELIVVNKGEEEAAFRISIENRRMQYDGSLEAAETALEGERFAKEFIRFSPRRVILQPGQRQTVRVSANTSGLEPGEYRSHLRLRSAPTSAGRQLQSMASTGQDNISIQLIAIRSLTIPVIARVGKLSSSVELTDARLTKSEDNDDGSVLEIAMQRDGSASSYGNLYIFSEDEPEPIFQARGIAVYTPNTERLVKLPLPENVSARLSGQRSRIVYRQENSGGPETSAKLTKVLN